MTPIKTHQCFDGVQELYRFDNGYGASVVRHMHSYGGPDGFWELAVINWNRGKGHCGKGHWEFDYTTHITDDVLGYLTRANVDEILEEIQALDVWGCPPDDDDGQPTEYDEWMSYDPEC